MNILRTVVFLAITMLLLVYAALLFAVLPITATEPSLQVAADSWILLGGFAVAVGGAGFQVLRTLKVYLQDLNDIDSADATQLVVDLIFGMPSTTPGKPSLTPTLRVHDGKADVNGPPVVLKVGGPAKLAVDHNSAVVTSHLGLLHRVLGPGFYDLEPFERIWSIVDLRPQRRTITVDFMTRDGIPAACQASIVCRVDGPPPALPEAGAAGSIMPYGFSADRVLQVALGQVVRKQEGGDRTADWVAGMAFGVLDGEVRDTLEQYRLDDFLNPRDIPGMDEGVDIVSPRRFMPDLERIIRRSVHKIGRDRGIVVERVELGVVRPAEAAISRQWLAFWQAKLQRHIDEQKIRIGSQLMEKAENTYVDAQIEFIQRMFVEVETLSTGGTRIPAQLILTGFMEVLHAMHSHNPQTQQLLLWQAQNLLMAMDTLQRDQTAFAHLPRPVGPQLPRQTP